MTAEVNWRPSFAAAQEEAQKAQLPVVLELYLETCPHCMRLHRETLTDPGVVDALNSKYIPVRLEGRSNIELVQQLKVTGAPTTLVFAADGKELHRFPGFYPPPEYLQELGESG